MGKKKDKKGKGKEKTVQKTEKKAEKRAKKELNEKGEEDIEKLIADFQEEDRRRVEVVEEKCPPPSSRANLTLTPHPDKDELIMFGGEFYTGKKMFVYNDLFFYNIRKNEWLKVTAPNAPPPRSAHQAVAVSQSGGQLWVFGGEFSSHTQNQFYHYKDLWVFHLKEKRWEKVNAPSGPSARSGHRMVAVKKTLFVFGGFHDNSREYKYFNDVYTFDLENYVWSKLDISGAVPSPRSGCVMAAWFTNVPRLVVYGGYSKERVKRDVDKGVVHTDMFVLTPEGKGKEVVSTSKWKWTEVRQSGDRPSPRSGSSLAVLPNNKAFFFGGVFDEEENDEQLQGVFYNEMFTFELGQGKWFPVLLRGQKIGQDKKKRRRKKEEGDEEIMEMDDKNSGEEEVMDEDAAGAEIEKLTLESEPTPVDQVAAEGGEESDVFTVKIGPQSQTVADTEINDGTSAKGANEIAGFIPSGRINALLAVKGNSLFMYGGLYEAGDKQFTLSDMYSLDLHRLDTWDTLISPDEKMQVWEESDSEGDDEMEGAVGGESDDSDEEDEDSDMDITFDDAPAREAGEELTVYFERTVPYWCEKAKEFCGVRLSEKKQRELAWELCQQAFKS